MHLVANWRAVLLRAWSVRLMLLAGLLSGLEVALPLFGDLIPVAPRVLAALTVFIVAAAFVARLIAQSKMENRE